VPGATKYTIQYKVSGATSWLTKKATSSPVILTNLSPSTTYKWRIRTVCSGDNSPYSTQKTFTTSAAAMAKNSAAKAESGSSSLNVYPNPARSTFVAELKLKEAITGRAAIQLINAQGITVYSGDAEVYNGELKKQVNTSSAFVPGHYLLRILLDGKAFDAKLVIQQ
jgi:hypothetical protein